MIFFLLITVEEGEECRDNEKNGKTFANKNECLKNGCCHNSVSNKCWVPKGMF